MSKSKPRPLVEEYFAVKLFGDNGYLAVIANGHGGAGPRLARTEDEAVGILREVKESWRQRNYKPRAKGGAAVVVRVRVVEVPSKRKGRK